MLIVLAILALVAALAIGYALGRASRRERDAGRAMPNAPAPADTASNVDTRAAGAALPPSNDVAEERRRLLEALSQAREETARYRQLVIDLEDGAPPPLLGGPRSPTPA